MNYYLSFYFFYLFIFHHHTFINLTKQLQIFFYPHQSVMIFTIDLLNHPLMKKKHLDL